MHPVFVTLRAFAGCFARANGTLRSQAVFYALAFFQLDGFAVPAPAQVSPTGTMSNSAPLGDDIANR
ncbi:MAG: hypothetical protein IH589_11105 [Anaerolineales bacterium]|nr:hypothetical protein [Anaerolineales bacterium]